MQAIPQGVQRENATNRSILERHRGDNPLEDSAERSEAYLARVVLSLLTFSQLKSIRKSILRLGSGLILKYNRGINISDISFITSRVEVGVPTE